MQKIINADKIIKTFISIVFVFACAFSRFKNGRESGAVNLTFSFLLTSATMIPVYFIYIFAAASPSAQIPSFQVFLQNKGKSLRNFMFERDLFIRDVFLWFLLSGMWLFVLEHSMGTSLFIAFFLAVLFYPFFSVWRYTVKIIPEEDLPPEIIYFGHPLKITDQTPDRAEKPEEPEQIEKQEKIKELKRTEKPAEQTEKPVPPPETPGQTEPVLPKDLRTIAIQLEMTTPFVKNESFCRNIASIARTLNRISDFADAVKQDAKTQDCVQEAAFYSREFYTMLLNYNKIACGVLHTEESGQLAAGVEAFAEDLKTALIKIFETAVNPKLLESKSRLNALRQEMRMKGLVE